MLKPFQNDYLLEKIKEYNNIIKPGKIGDFEIKVVDCPKDEIVGYMYNKEMDLGVEILELHGPDNIWMKLSPLEIEGSFFPIKRAKGRVGIVGLGLGYVAEEIAKKANVTEVVVYEISKDVVELYYKNFAKNKKIKVINRDAYEAESTEFDFFYVDIYEYKLTSQMAEDYKKFKALHQIEEYSFFGMEHFMLSCSYDEIVWVYVPEHWMEMSKLAFQALQDSNLLPHYKQLDKELVSNVLADFKVVLDDIE